MPPIRLSDSELDAVMAAARPLPVHLRDPFLHAVAQRQFFDPPDLSRSNDTSKYR